ncbi:glycosyltransferase family 4 protein [Novacetimonas hansenii]|uniref:Glycosyl transferase family 1 domain-containing protein n=3 Tax=Novacetimonas hansenii TaxID=436 RepID=A0ABQ0SHK3_NOVHA|nr:glycosyltransferase family 1 protein [Novacetimonas hansenii]EFG85782.1 glycosyl transferase group 1 [Novacetimonas hansenii ATCC 23769]GAN84910.1 glycosyl transferase group 1 [Novacetimonas hansenii JCM 7643]GEC64665.1 hypothetical protein GHA01_25140 [Novacetimonas hansenii]
MTDHSSFPCSICIDGFNLALEKGTGIATYARVLSYNLQALHCRLSGLYGLNFLDSTPASLREVLFFDQIGRENRWKRGKFPTPHWLKESFRDVRGITATPVPLSGRIERRMHKDRLPDFERLLNIRGLFQRAPQYFNKTGKFLRVRIPNPPQIMHWTYPLPIIVEGSYNIYTVHDMVPLVFPSTTLDNKKYHFNLLKRISEVSDAVCTVSESSRNDFLSFFPEARDKVFNTYQSLDVYSENTDDAEKVDISKFGLMPKEYFLFCGSLEPKKNIGRIIQAFLATRSSRKLVIIGAMAWKNEEDNRLIEYGIELGRIIRLDYVSRATLQKLVSSSRALLFPSLTEGFGLPVLEAMALGAPVLTSKEGALPEVAGDATLMVDAYDLSSIEAGIARLDQDDDLCKSLCEKGMSQAEMFSPAAYQKRLAAMYRAVLAHART